MVGPRRKGRAAQAVERLNAEILYCVLEMDATSDDWRGR